MKLIETNFGRIKNNAIKQAKWIEEYEKLKGVRQGSAYQKADRNYSGQLRQEDIAKELGVDTSTIPMRRYPSAAMGFISSASAI